jgi:diadenosine tetraphosphate (Ap4A) HIT family hydrolase
MSGFVLHDRLAADTHFVCDLQICRVLLMNDSRFSWLILVPRMADLTELHDVPVEHQQALWKEIISVSGTLADFARADKMNTAALGNQVPQLHVHVIARYTSDAAWPNPVWGSGPSQPYTSSAARELVDKLSHALET